MFLIISVCQVSLNKEVRKNGNWAYPTTSDGNDGVAAGDGGGC